MFWKKITIILCSLVFFVSGMAFAASGSTTISILHTNDMHSRIKTADDSGQSIGLAEITAVVKNIRQKNPDTLFVDAGDTLHGMPDIDVSKGENMVVLMNQMGYDCMVPGNHDFNYGEDQFKKLSSELKFPVLSANIVDNRTGKLVYQPYETRDMNGVKIAIFGLTTPETKYKTFPSYTEHTEFLDPITVSRQMVQQLRPQADILIAVTHIGLDKSSAITTDKLAKEVPGIDVIIDGHSHTELPHGLQIGNTLIAQAGYHDHKLGRVDILVKNHKIVSKKASLYSENALLKMVPFPDANMTKMVSDLVAKNEPLFHKIVAFSPVTLSGDMKLVRSREAELGNLVADALRWRAKADIAFVNGGSIRADLREGPVTTGAIMKIFPFGNTAMMISLTGKDIQKALEHSVSAYPALSGGFLQISGLTFDVDYSKPAGARVSQVLIGGKPLQMNQSYTVGLSDFLELGGDGYTMFTKAPVKSEMGTVDDTLAVYLNEVKSPDFKLGRIRVVSAAVQKAA